MGRVCHSLQDAVLSLMSAGVERILRHLGAWHDPPAYRSLGVGRPPRRIPQKVPGPYTYEPCDDVYPTPNYENVLTD